LNWNSFLVIYQNHPALGTELTIMNIRFRTVRTHPGFHNIQQ